MAATLVTFLRHGRRPDDDIRVIVRALASTGGAVEVEHLDDASDLPAVIAALSGRRLVLAGDDIAFHRLTQFLFDRGITNLPVGLVPLGECRVADGFSMPGDNLVEIALRAGAGPVAPADLVVDDSAGVFVSHVTVGDPDGLTFRAGVLADGEAMDTEGGVRSVTVASAPQPDVPDARPDDGKLHVMVRRGDGMVLRSLATEVRMAASGVSHEVDGTWAGKFEDRVWRIRPGALSVYR